MMIFVDRLGESPKYYASNEYRFVGTSVTSVRVWGKKHDLTQQVEKLLAEARADEAQKDCAAMCSMCAGLTTSKPATKAPTDGHWWHQREDGGGFKCFAGPIHERLHREKAIDK